MAPECGVCHDQDSKYKCPVCELRYCSIACYKTHKTSHESEKDAKHEHEAEGAKVKVDRPGTTQRIPKIDFTGFETDRDFQRLLSRYPLLKVQLQTIYGLTLDPGPDEARTWNRQHLPGFESPHPSSRRYAKRRGQGRSGRGSWDSRGARGARGARHTVPEERQRGQWTQEKGDREALDVLKKMREVGDGASKDEWTKADGVKEFVQLCRMKFGGESPTDADDQGTFV